MSLGSFQFQCILWRLRFQSAVIVGAPTPAKELLQRHLLLWLVELPQVGGRLVVLLAPIPNLIIVRFFLFAISILLLFANRLCLHAFDIVIDGMIIVSFIYTLGIALRHFSCLVIKAQIIDLAVAVVIVVGRQT